MQRGRRPGEAPIRARSCRLQRSLAGNPGSATLARRTIGEFTPQAACPHALRPETWFVAAAGARLNDRWSRHPPI